MCSFYVDSKLKQFNSISLKWETGFFRFFFLKLLLLHLFGESNLKINKSGVTSLVGQHLLLVACIAGLPVCFAHLIMLKHPFRYLESEISGEAKSCS